LKLEALPSLPNQLLFLNVRQLSLVFHRAVVQAERQRGHLLGEDHHRAKVSVSSYLLHVIKLVYHWKLEDEE